VHPFQLSDFLTRHATLHARNGLSACYWNWRVAVDAKNAGNTGLSSTGVLDMALQVFFNALLYEVH
jgi:hypothetical protein